MIIPLSLVLLLAIVVAFLVRYMTLRVWHALVCIAFGFALASTSLAPEINQLLNGTVNTLTGHG